MTLIARYPGPSPAAKRFTVGAVNCVIDVFYDPDQMRTQLILAEQQADGWHYINDGATGIWTFYMANGPYGLGDGAPWGPPGVPGPNQFSGTFAEQVNHWGVPGMVTAFKPAMNTLLAARFPNGAGSSTGGGSTSGQSPEEHAAQQIVAGGIAALTVVVNATSPPIVS